MIVYYDKVDDDNIIEIVSTALSLFNICLYTFNIKK